jgi:hypothetical protein
MRKECIVKICPVRKSGKLKYLEKRFTGINFAIHPMHEQVKFFLKSSV